MNLPSSDKISNGEGDTKCSKMLSRLLSSQAESTANTMKILGSLLKDDGCSLNTAEQQVAAKLMGKMMSGKCSFVHIIVLLIYVCMCMLMCMCVCCVCACVCLYYHLDPMSFHLFKISYILWVFVIGGCCNGCGGSGGGGSTESAKSMAGGGDGMGGAMGGQPVKCPESEGYEKFITLGPEHCSRYEN